MWSFIELLIVEFMEAHAATVCTQKFVATPFLAKREAGAEEVRQGYV